MVASEALTETDVIRFPDRTSLDFEMVHIDPSVVRFEGLAAGRKHVEIWLAQNATAMLRELRIDDDATIEAPPESDRRRWVHYGSSISHCMEAEHPTGTWPAVAARSADVDLYSLGLAGQCQLDQFAARTIRDAPGRPDQPEARHQRRQRRHDARAGRSFLLSTACSTRSATVTPRYRSW